MIARKTCGQDNRFLIFAIMDDRMKNV